MVHFKKEVKYYFICSGNGTTWEYGMYDWGNVPGTHLYFKVAENGTWIKHPTNLLLKSCEEWFEKYSSFGEDRIIKYFFISNVLQNMIYSNDEIIRAMAASVIENKYINKYLEDVKSKL